MVWRLSVILSRGRELGGGARPGWRALFLQGSSCRFCFRFDEGLLRVRRAMAGALSRRHFADLAAGDHGGGFAGVRIILITANAHHSPAEARAVESHRLRRGLCVFWRPSLGRGERLGWAPRLVKRDACCLRAPGWCGGDRDYHGGGEVFFPCPSSPRGESETRVGAGARGRLGAGAPQKGPTGEHQKKGRGGGGGAKKHTLCRAAFEVVEEEGARPPDEHLYTGAIWCDAANC